MASSDDFKREIKAGNLTDALKMALTEAIELKITTWVMPADADTQQQLSGVEDKEPEPPPGYRMMTRINIVDGDIDNEIGSTFLSSGPYSELREFHLGQVEKGREIIHNNLQMLQELFGALAEGLAGRFRPAPQPPALAPAPNVPSTLPVGPPYANTPGFESPGSTVSPPSPYPNVAIVTPAERMPLDNLDDSLAHAPAIEAEVIRDTSAPPTFDVSVLQPEAPPLVEDLSLDLPDHDPGHDLVASETAPAAPTTEVPIVVPATLPLVEDLSLDIPDFNQPMAEASCAPPTADPPVQESVSHPDLVDLDIDFPSLDQPELDSFGTLPELGAPVQAIAPQPEVVELALDIPGFEAPIETIAPQPEALELDLDTPSFEASVETIASQPEVLELDLDIPDFEQPVAEGSPSPDVSLEAVIPSFTADAEFELDLPGFDQPLVEAAASISTPEATVKAIAPPPIADLELDLSPDLPSSSLPNDQNDFGLSQPPAQVPDLVGEPIASSASSSPASDGFDLGDLDFSSDLESAVTLEDTVTMFKPTAQSAPSSGLLAEADTLEPLVFDLSPELDQLLSGENELYPPEPAPSEAVTMPQPPSPVLGSSEMSVEETVAALFGDTAASDSLGAAFPGAEVDRLDESALNELFGETLSESNLFPGTNPESTSSQGKSSPSPEDDNPFADFPG